MSACRWCTRETQVTCPECWGTGEVNDSEDDDTINQNTKELLGDV